MCCTLAVPDYQRFMYPLLEMASDGKEHSLQEAYQYLADLFQLTREDREEHIPSGRQLLYKNRIGWAKTYLQKAGLIKNVRRGSFIITERGKKVVEDPGVRDIDKNFLMQFPEFQTFVINKENNVEPIDNEEPSLTPLEQLERSYHAITQEIKEELLEKVKNSSPEFFERLVVDLLVAMGYGGSIKDAGRAIGRSGDEGIDGVIKEDVLGLDLIYVQAKRWENVVGRPEIQKFAGSLEGKRAKKGIFITTSDFTEAAREYVDRIEKKIILINGSELADYMFRFDIGVTKVAQYTLKKVDLDYFDEE
jgi:restriction system protein